MWRISSGKLPDFFAEKCICVSSELTLVRGCLNLFPIPYTQDHITENFLSPSTHHHRFRQHPLAIYGSRVRAFKMLEFPLCHLVAVLLASFCTTPALVQISKQFLGSKNQTAHNHEGLCEDEDSIASDSTLRFGRGNVPQLFILVCSIVGLLLSAIAIQQVPRDMLLAPWLSWGIWVRKIFSWYIYHADRLGFCNRPELRGFP